MAAARASREAPPVVRPRPPLPPQVVPPPSAPRRCLLARQRSSPRASTPAQQDSAAAALSATGGASARCASGSCSGSWVGNSRLLAASTVGAKRRTATAASGAAAGASGTEAASKKQTRPATSSISANNSLSPPKLMGDAIEATAANVDVPCRSGDVVRADRVQSSCGTSCTCAGPLLVLLPPLRNGILKAPLMSMRASMSMLRQAAPKPRASTEEDSGNMASQGPSSGEPLKSCTKQAPMAQTSILAVCGPPSRTSGGTNCGVPQMPCGLSASKAHQPKSQRRTRPSASSNKFSSLRSRCTIPCPCRCAVPREAPRSQCAASVSGTMCAGKPCVACQTEPPMQSSNNMYACVASSAKSATSAMFGCRSAR
mmetsp:Transcript_23232/g.59304  ORF Transcript_23232/g.59304 Transcript_23232/m.59304 type:complete len:371 (-) Transcript_23232:287-1399(-)